MAKQKTIRGEAQVQGVGLHTGNPSTVTLKPAPAGHGIVFFRTDLPGTPAVPADIDFVTSLERGTCLGKGDAVVYSVEHIMAALAGMEVDNVRIEVNSNEVPLGDGSARPFVEALARAEMEEQDFERKFLTLTEPLMYENGSVALSLLPSDRFRLSLMIDYQHPSLGAQHTTLFEMGEFEKEYSHSRTFCFLSEVLKLREAGIIKGGTLDSAIVVQDVPYSAELLATIQRLFNQKELFWGDNGFLNNTALRYPNELCRHKALDLIGDLYLLGAPLRAHVLGARTGHAANIGMARLIRQACKRQAARSEVLDVNAIMKILPHRYPFLLVDRVLEIELGKKIVALKNVTINEPFFQGHFPGFPIMPGVLLIEALAQASAILAMRSMDNLKDAVVFFMSIDNAKFRKPVVAGDALRLEVEALRLKGKIGKFAGKVFVGHDLVCEAELMATVAEKN